MLGSLLIVIVLVIGSDYLKCAQPQWTDTFTYWVYINPLARVFEFVLGMCLANAWLNSAKFREFFGSHANGSQLLAIALVIVALSTGAFFKNSAWAAKESLFYWLMNSGGCLSYACLIAAFASGRGWLAKRLEQPALVWLGEISYSLYLVHGLVLYPITNTTSQWSLPLRYLALAGSLCLVIFVSYLIYRFVEVPGRKLLLKALSDKR